jgi:SAM-dependent methyltransferase
MPADMKRDWNERARENARFYIASHEEGGEAAFAASGRRDVELFFGELEHLLTPTTDVVDIGCGIGRMDEFVAPSVRRLTGIDVSGDMIRQARSRLGQVNNVEFVEGDGETIPLPDACADLVFSHIVFQHIPRKHAARYFPEVFRVLRPGGRFVFQMPEMPGGGQAPEPPDDDTFEMRFYEEQQLRSELTALGFRFRDVARHPISSPKLDFNQMRLHFEKPKD